jgi:hypothetical protein
MPAEDSNISDKRITQIATERKQQAPENDRIGNT